ncbi:MAG: HD domain-containing protein [Firmicutes bacterium]|nr:HD domain-containing protein [Bacillota bacterium]
MTAKRISEDEVKQLYNQFETPAHVIRHCRAVANAALKVSAELNKHGHSFDLDLIWGSGLAHDIARTSEDHGGVGADALDKLGYHDEADIVRVHMFYAIETIDNLTEKDMVCLGDKLIKEDKYVGLEPRMQYLLERIPDDPEREKRIRERWAELAILQENIEKIIGCTLDSLFTDEEKY